VSFCQINVLIIYLLSTSLFLNDYILHGQNTTDCSNILLLEAHVRAIIVLAIGPIEAHVRAIIVLAIGTIETHVRAIIIVVACDIHLSFTTPCPKKTVQNYFRQNVVKFPPTLTIFGTPYTDSTKDRFM